MRHRLINLEKIFLKCKSMGSDMVVSINKHATMNMFVMSVRD